MTATHFTTEELSQEEWRDISMTTGTYQVSNLGRVRRNKPGKSTYIGRLCKISFSKKDRYPIVNIGLKSKQKIHALVAAAFIGPCPEGKEVNHIDGIKSNCRATNLEYLTHAENMQHAWRVIAPVKPWHSRGILHSLQRRKYTDQFMLEEIRRVTDILGHRPSQEEFRNLAQPSPEALALRFGTWIKAINKALHLNLSHNSNVGLALNTFKTK